MTGIIEMDGDNIVDVYSQRTAQSDLSDRGQDHKLEDELYCKEELEESDPGYDVALTCDLDGDGKYDIEGGGNRGWLDLDNGGGGAAE